ncbi:hypothetical protein PGB90_005105 [Kerria lacca]
MESCKEKPIFDKTKRLRKNVSMLKESDDENSLSEHSEDSEDEWNDLDKKRNSKQKNRNKSTQTLKKILAEKTKILLRKKVKINENYSEVEQKPVLDKKNNLLPLKCDEIVTMKEEMKIKEEDTDIKSVKKNEPVVLTYSTVKNSAWMSPFLIHTETENITNNSHISTVSSVPTSTALMMNQSFSESKVSTLSPDRSPSSSLTSNIQNLHPLSNNQPVLSNQLAAPSVSTYSISGSNQTPCSVSSSKVSSSLVLNRSSPFSVKSPISQNCIASETQNENSPSSSVARLKINSDLRISPEVSRSLIKSSIHNVQVPQISPGRKARNNQKTLSEFRKCSKINSVQNNIYKPRKLFSNDPSTVNIKTLSPSFKNSISLKNISRNGTVIVNGSNSVTITPRKIINERPPLQRTLFKNEIEGVIAARSENGILRYVVNLANGTHMPLTNLQVIKLREQNNGILPTKLKIPVPSDVAAKIEPSFLIED